MSDNYTAAVRAIVRLLPGADPEARIHRIDVGTDGTYDVTLDDPSCPAWFRFAGGRLISLDPGQDERIPLAQLLVKRRTSFEVLAWRPGRRLVLRSLGSGEPGILKGYRKRRGAKALRNHRIARLTSGPGAFLVPAVHEHPTVPDCLAFECLGGGNPPVRASAAGLHRAVGVGIRRLQQTPAEELDTFGVEEELEVLARLSARVERAGVPRATRWSEVHGQMLRAAEDLPPAQLAPAHRDLHDRQLLVTDGGLALLDFDLLCRADVALDPANLSAHYALRLMQSPPPSAAAEEAACTQALLEGLGREDEDFRARLGFYRATTFLRLALVYALRPRWAFLGDALTARAAEGLDLQVRS